MSACLRSILGHFSRHGTLSLLGLLAACSNPAEHKDTDGLSPEAPEALEPSTDDPVVPAADADGDGYAAAALGGTDCDDTDPSISPGAEERCNGIDDNCDDLVDDADPDRVTDRIYYMDGDDGDGFGDVSREVFACEQPDGMVALMTDCDDHDDEVHPHAAEVCNGLDHRSEGPACPYGAAAGAGSPWTI